MDEPWVEDTKANVVLQDLTPSFGLLRGNRGLSPIVQLFGVHYTSVSRLLKAYEVDQKA